jgi:hypothetical protein
MEPEMIDLQIGVRSKEHLLFGVHEATGLIAGYQPAASTTDTARLAYCIRNCLLPKQSNLESLQLAGNWPVSGLFGAFNVPESLIGEFRPILRGVLKNYRIILEVRPDQASLPQLVQSTLLRVTHRMEEAFCLSQREIEYISMENPDICRRAALHGYSYWPERGFVEQITSSPAWDQYHSCHPLPSVDDYLQERLRNDFQAVGDALFACQAPSPVTQA